MNTSKANANPFIRFHVLVYAAIVFACVLGIAIAAPSAYAAGDKPDSVMLKIGSDTNEIDVTKNVATLNKNTPDVELAFTINDAYTNLSSSIKRREFNLVDASGKTVETIYSDNGNGGHFTIGKLKDDCKLVLVTTTREASSTAFVKRYEQQLNVRTADTKPAEQSFSIANTPGNAGISKDGGTWSFSNGLEYEFKNTGFKFLEGTKMNLGAIRLPLQYKHNPDGTTIVGINANPDDKSFYEAVKNGNVWQKFSNDKMAEMTKQMDKGWSGKKLGSWGGKGFDWAICGYMEYNTKDPAAPRAVNLVISAGLKADGHAQYLIFTGTITFTIGGKATLQGKLTPAKGLEGKFNLGAYAGLELYIGLGLNYVASVGGYGKGQINIDFQILPETQLENIKLSGELGAKAKLFGFTIYTWTILKGEKPLYTRNAAKKLPDPLSLANNSSSSSALPSASSKASDTQATQETPESTSDSGESAQTNPDGTATSPTNVSGDTPYPLDSRDYLTAQEMSENKTEVAPEGASLFAQSEGLIAQDAQDANTILPDIYGEADPACVTTNNGPVVVYVADANQVGGDRDDANRSVLAYTRYTDSGWTKPQVIDGLSTSDYAEYADYMPSVSTDGENCYVSWLAADSSISEGATISDVGNKLDIRMATIDKDDNITVETVSEESDNAGTMPASPKAVKVGNDLYVGWYTNQTSGNSGEVIGLSGNHTVRLFKRNADGVWSQVSEATTEPGAITSFDVGVYGNTAACAWSFDSDFKTATEKDEQGVDIAFPRNGQEDGSAAVTELHSSSVYTLASGANEPMAVAERAGNAQFAKKSDADVLTFAAEVTSDDAATPDLSIMSSSAPGANTTCVLDGSKVNLPTPYYLITGDIGGTRNGNISFLTLDNGTSDIESLITMGNGDSDWTSVVEATVEEDVVTNYCATYYPNGLPLFIYLTENQSAADGELTAQAEDNGGAAMNQTTEDSLKHLSVTDADYDEYSYKTGEEMPVKVYVENDGMLDVNGVDIWVDDGTLTKIASSDINVPLNTDEEDEANAEDPSISFNYTIPSKDEFGEKAHEFTVYAAPKGARVTESTIEHAKATDSAKTLSLGAASLSLNAEQQIIDDQESIAATVTNDGVVPHGAQLVFADADTGDELDSVTIPDLEEGEKFEYTYAAPNKYFQNDGIENIIVSLENDGSDNDGYDINTTEFISTWKLNTVSSTPASSTAASSAASQANAKTMPKTSDQIVLAILIILGAIVVCAPIAVRVASKARAKR